MSPSAAAPALEVLRHLVAAGHRPAALIGNWFGHRAVVAADVEMTPCAPADLFAAPAPCAGDPWSFGHRPYSGRAAQGVADCVALLSDDGTWSLSGPASSNEADPARGALLEAIAAAESSAMNEGEDGAGIVKLGWDGGDRASHRRAVNDCRQAIAAGEVYQACISTRFHAQLPKGVEPLAHAAGWFCERALHYQPARAAFLPGNLDAGVPIVASLSPEEFLIRSGRRVSETPIKGTIPLDRDPRELLASDKDVAENIMIVDLVRHDLGQVAEVGSVEVTDLLSVRPAPGVWHLFSTVEARLPEGLSHAELLEACFPPASVTGTPKIRAAQLIEQWEPVDRGVHCGCIGAAHGEDLELNVAIRTAEYESDPTSGEVRVAAGVGGGITIGSDADAEWAEIEAKATPLLE